MAGAKRHPRPARVRETPMTVIKPLVMREGWGTVSALLLFETEGDDIVMFAEAGWSRVECVVKRGR